MFRCLWSEVKTAALNIVEDMACFALTLSVELCITVQKPCKSRLSSSKTPQRVIYVSNVAELTVELRPADEGEPVTMFVCSAADLDITESSVDDVGDVHCQRQNLQRRGRFDSERSL